MVDFKVEKQRLKTRLEQVLPGFEAQRLMEPPFRGSLNLDSSQAKHAATMLLLHEHTDKGLAFTLIKRTSHPLDKHKGQISFPGGRIESGENPMQAAFRELHEEINISKDQVELIGSLSSLYIPVSNFLVHPFVGYLKDTTARFIPDPSEVDEILHIAMADFLDDVCIKHTDMKLGRLKKTVPDVPYFDLNNELVWGATAMMLAEFRNLYLAL